MCIWVNVQVKVFICGNLLFGPFFFVAQPQQQQHPSVYFDNNVQRCLNVSLKIGFCPTWFSLLLPFVQNQPTIHANQHTDRQTDRHANKHLVFILLTNERRNKKKKEYPYEFSIQFSSLIWILFLFYLFLVFHLNYRKSIVSKCMSSR